jgi:hypothetical protein
MSGTTQMAEIKTVVLVHGAFADGAFSTGSPRSAARCVVSGTW